MPHHQPPPRRQLLQTLLGLGAWYSLPAPAQNAIVNEAVSADQIRAAGQKSIQTTEAGRLIVVLLRGAYDGLSALVPYSDPDYYRLRPTIAIPAPDGTAQTALKLDDTFALHPAMAALLPLWQQGLLAVVPCAGSPDPTRSHFDAQHDWETGQPGHRGVSTGWMNALSGASPDSSALGVGESNPLILAGSTPVQLVPRGQAATRAGSLGNPRTRDAVMQLYGGDDAVSKAFREGAQSRLQTTRMLSETDVDAAPANAPSMQPKAMKRREQIAADNGAGPARGLRLDAQHLATLMQQNPHLRLGFLSAGGWDTHANQGAVNGPLARNLGELAATLVQLQRDFDCPNDVVLVASEFGRTSAENGSRGTDHGHGNALWLMGRAVNGGRWHGHWRGLAASQLHEGRDLPAHHDFRAVLAQVLRRTQGVPADEVQRLFPGLARDDALNRLMRA